MNLVAGWCSRIQFLGSGLRGDEAPSHHTQLRQRAKGRMYISKSPPEHLPLHVKNNNGMPEHFPTHPSCVQLLSAFPTSKSSLPLQALGEWGGWECQDMHTWHFFVLPSFCSRQREQHPCKPSLSAGSSRDPLGSASTISLTPRLWGEETEQGGMREWMKTEENLLGFSPPSGERGWGWDAPDLPASHAAAPGDTIRGRASHWSDP